MVRQALSAFRLGTPRSGPGSRGDLPPTGGREETCHGRQCAGCSPQFPGHKLQLTQLQMCTSVQENLKIYPLIHKSHLFMHYVAKGCNWSNHPQHLCRKDTFSTYSLTSLTVALTEKSSVVMLPSDQRRLTGRKFASVAGEDPLFWFQCSRLRCYKIPTCAAHVKNWIKNHFGTVSPRKWIIHRLPHQQQRLTTEVPHAYFIQERLVLVGSHGVPRQILRSGCHSQVEQLPNPKHFVPHLGVLHEFLDLLATGVRRPPT